MFNEWIQPVLSWLGIGLVPLLILILIIVIFVKGD